MAEKICESCGGNYDDMLPECPYCGSVNYKGAEAEYLGQLEDIRQDMEDLKEVPKEEIKKEFGKQGQFLRKVLVTIVIIFMVLIGLYLLMQADWGSGRNEKSDFLWKQENYPIMDQLYENGDYETLRQYYTEESNPTWEWSHDDFFTLYMRITELMEVYNWERNGEETDAYGYALILQAEWQVLYSSEKAGLDEQEQVKLAEYIQTVQENFDTRWRMTEAEQEEISRQVEKNHGWISIEICEAYVEKWLESK